MSSAFSVNVFDNSPRNRAKITFDTNKEKCEKANESNCCGESSSSHHVKLNPSVRKSTASIRRNSKNHDLLCKVYDWHSNKAYLEIKQPKVELNVRDNNVNTRLSKLVTEANQQLQHHMLGYEDKVKGLMAEVGTLQNETRSLNNEISRRTYLNVLEAEIARQKEAELLMLAPHHARHMKCYLENEEENTVDKRVVNTLSKLIKSASLSKYKVDDTPDDDVIETNVSKSPSEKPAKKGLKKAGISKKNKEKKITSTKHHSAAGDKKDYADEELTPIDSNENLIDYPIRMKDLEEKIDDQLYLLSSMPDEELKELEDKVEEKRRCLFSSQCKFQEKREEFNSVGNELNEVEAAEFCLQKNINHCQKSIRKKMTYLKVRASDDDALYCHLVTLEATCAQMRQQVAGLREVEHRVNQKNALQQPDVFALNRHKNLLLEKLGDFEDSHNVTRKLISAEVKILVHHNDLQEHIKILMKKIPGAEEEIHNLTTEIKEKKKLASQNSTEFGVLSKELEHVTGMRTSSEKTNQHLQKAIEEKDFENNILLTRLQEANEKKSNEQKRKREKKEALNGGQDSFDQELEQFRMTVKEEQERVKAIEKKLKKARIKLAEREKELEKEVEKEKIMRKMLKKKSARLSRRESNSQPETNKQSNENLAQQEKNVIQHMMKDKVIEDMMKEVARLKDENSDLKCDFEHQRDLAASSKEKCLKAQDELLCLLDQFREHKSTQDELNEEVLRAFYEADAACCACQKVETISTCMPTHSQSEFGQLNDVIQVKLDQLQSLPDLLKKTEMRLYDTLDKLKKYDQQSAEQSQIIVELLDKSHGNREVVSSLKNQFSEKNAENQQLQNQVCDLYHRLEDRSNNVRQSLSDTIKLQEKTHQLQEDLDAAARQRNVVRQRLDLLTDERRKSEVFSSEIFSPENLNGQNYINNLENQLHVLQSDAIAASRTKQQSERECQRDLQDVVDKLEQTEASNKSLKEYVSAFRSSFVEE